MEQILKNMANHLLIEYCLAKGIDCSGTYCAKDGRGFTYILRPQFLYDKTGDGLAIASITFHKNQLPTYGWN